MIDLAGARHDNYAQLRTDTTGHVSRCIVRSGVQRGRHPEPYRVRPDRAHQRPGSIP